MSTSGRWIVLPLLLALSSTRADDWRWAGPLRYPSAHPFQSIFLETPALDPVLPAKGTLDLRLGHYNTQTVSTNTYFTPAGQALLLNTAQGRPQTPLAAASLAATARTRPDQTYLFADTETTRLDLTWLQPLAPGWGVQVEVPFLGHHGGVFDPVIEGFHGAFNFPTLGRNDAPHNRTQLFVARGDDSRFYDGPFGHWKWLLALGVASVGLFFAGYFIFDRLRDSFAEEV
ncbi:MAG: DUF3187 family protein [Armatimonadetes bacterium]|nr:DUF3187 family protein [Armatimonadota bacterium]